MKTVQDRNTGSGPGPRIRRSRQGRSREILKLVFRDLVYYRKPFLALLAGTMLGTAVITGALVLGDSVRYSLEHIVSLRLGGIRQAVISPGRYFTAALADSLETRSTGRHSASTTGSPGDRSSVIPETVRSGSPGSGCAAGFAPALSVDASAFNPSGTQWLNRVRVTGIDNRFALFWEKPFDCPGPGAAVISSNASSRLGLKKGDDLVIRLPLQGMASGNTPFAAVKSELTVLRLKVSAIAGEENGGRFSLQNNQSASFNIFVSLSWLNHRLGLDGRANLILAGDIPKDLPGPDSLLRECWQPSDAGLVIRNRGMDDRPELTSAGIFMDGNISGASASLFPGCEPVLTYLVNSFSLRGRSVPYSFVSAARPSYMGTDPGEGGIIISSWLAAELGASAGDSLKLKYFVPDNALHLAEDSAVFIVRQVRPLGDAIWDSTLMPAFPGISRTVSCREWETGTPIDLGKIRKQDEDYWNRYRGTPKAMILLSEGQRIWKNPFGMCTSIRFGSSAGNCAGIASSILKKIEPRSLGLFFRPVWKEGLGSAAGSAGFGELFLSLGFFIIAAALLLVGMIFSAHLRSRQPELSLLSAMGFSKGFISRLVAAEMLFLALGGGIAGAPAGILYNRLMLAGLGSIWYDAVGVSGLIMKVYPLTVLLGAAAGALAAVPVMAVVLFFSLRKTAREGISSGRWTFTAGYHPGNSWVSLLVSLLFLSAAAGLEIYFILNGSLAATGLSLLPGALVLGSAIFLQHYLLGLNGRSGGDAVSGIFRLSLHNAAVRRGRSLTVISLLALGIFSIFITAAQQKGFSGLENSRSSGTGGFSCWAESSIPLRYDPFSEQGLREYGLVDDGLRGKVSLTAMQKLDGDDASCLNLNLPARPAVLGVPAEAFSRDRRFSFLELAGEVDPKDPWKYLERPSGNGIIPAFADQTVITWGLRKKTGDTVFISDGKGGKIGLRLAGGLDNSVFQGYLLVSAALLRHYVPSVYGYRIFLAETSPAVSGSLPSRLESEFKDYGMAALPASEKLASFNAVENTYISVFLLLGALGLLTGTIGLGMVLMRSIQERKEEFAVLSAMGFPSRSLLKLAAGEHVFLLLAGMTAGILPAVAGMLPRILTEAGGVPFLYLSLLSSLILLNGFLWIIIPAGRLLKKHGKGVVPGQQEI